MGDYPDDSLGAGLLLIAQIINANVGARILYITYGGFDNHAGEDDDHDPLLTDVSDSIKAFFDDLDGHGKSHDVLLMTWSEFGRRAQDNGSNGTDHGTSAPHFVVGDAVVSRDPRRAAGPDEPRRQRKSARSRTTSAPTTARSCRTGWAPTPPRSSARAGPTWGSSTRATSSAAQNGDQWRPSALAR